MRKLAGFAVVVVVLPVVVAGCYVGGVHLTHRRDESAYVTSLARTQLDEVEMGAASADLPASTVLVADGQRACDWLAGQPRALWRSGPHFRPLGFLDRYAAETTGRTVPWSSPLTEYDVADAAFAHLCPATMELRRPLPGFRGSSD